MKITKKHSIISLALFTALFISLPGMADDEESTAKATAKSSAKKTKRGFQPSVKLGIEDIQLETGWLPDAPEANGHHTLSLSPYVLWQPSREWEFRGGIRLDAMAQTGKVDHNEALVDYTDTYVRYRAADTRITLGAQTILWGRVDEIAPTDRVSRADLTRFILDDLPERRRSQLAARLEQNWGETKLDLVWLPVFRAAQMPDLDSVWSPINRTTGRIIGIAPSPVISGAIATSRIEDDEHGSGGGGARLKQTGESFDFGLTLSRTRHSLPYYEIIPAGPVTRFVGRHPFSNQLGLDVELTTGDLVWRMETVYNSDIPVTLNTLSFDTVKSFEWVGGLEFFPGGKDTRINLQLAARKLLTDKPILDIGEYYGLNGEIETEFGNGRWKAGARFATGLNKHDVYLNPSIKFVGWEPHELYLALHYFEGSDNTLGGFHQDHSLVSVGLKTRF